jgi:FMN phosphatase YigB (HAD superfamily)
LIPLNWAVVIYHDHVSFIGSQAAVPPVAVLFDLYDTLVHAPASGSFYRAVPAALGVGEARWLTCYRALGRAAMLGDVPDMAARVGRACHDAGEPRDRDLVARVVREQLPLFYARIRLDPQALAALDGLRAAGLRLAVVSNAASYSERLLDDFSLRARLNAIAMSWSLGVLKPDPRSSRACADLCCSDLAAVARALLPG